MKGLYLCISQHIHSGSMVVVVACDLLWSVPKGEFTASWLGMILLPFLIVTIFIAGFGAVTLIQRLGSGDEWSANLLKCLSLGILAAISFSVIGMVGATGLGLMRLTYGVDEEVILLQRRIEKVTDNSDLEEVYNTERHLLDVVCTRARDHLLVTSMEPGSEFLEDMGV